MRKDFSLPTPRGDVLSCTLYSEASFGEQPLLIYAHGFKGFKDWAFVPHAGKTFAQQGFSFLCFNFSHNGIGPDMESFSEEEKFEQNSVSLEIEELQEVIKKSCHSDFFGGKAHGGLGLIGHSRGGGVAIVAASRQPEVQAIATWAGLSSFDRYSKTQLQEWEEKGYQEVINSRTGQTLRMGKPMLYDIKNRTKRDLHILHAVRNLKRPYLILHGQEDETVPPYEAEQLGIFGDNSLTEMRMIPSTGHTFDIRHPFEGSSPAFDMVLSQSIDFFREKLH